jgi:hypothetical protein
MVEEFEEFERPNEFEVPEQKKLDPFQNIHL